MIGAPAGRGHIHAEGDPSLGGELEGVGKQIFQHLLQPFKIGIQAARKLGIHLDIKSQVLGFGNVAEAPLHGVAHAGKRYFFGLHGDCA